MLHVTSATLIISPATTVKIGRTVTKNTIWYQSIKLISRCKLEISLYVIVARYAFFTKDNINSIVTYAQQFNIL